MTGPDRSGGGGVPAGVVVLTDRRQALRPLVDVVRDAVTGGARWVVLRERDLPRDVRLQLADELRTVLATVGGTLVVAGPDPLGGDAVHLPAADSEPMSPEVRLVGRSCHNADELSQLSGVDYVTLSPVFPTGSKPGYGPALGTDGLAQLVRRTRTPVLALGGITTPEQVTACRAAGAGGVAVMGAVMRAGDPAALVGALLAAAVGR
ncbi:thiamine phosphate synthase [Micromonospora sonneratiae]|uniref:Thiamine phosphate synthase n=1 Tax=Micromonospora sonneratiae TaxID=1184706 RepID=A0ABW3YHN4_9ACTN